MILAGLGYMAAFTLVVFVVLLVITKIRVHAIYNQPDDEKTQLGSVLEALAEKQNSPPCAPAPSPEETKEKEE